MTGAAARVWEEQRIVAIRRRLVPVVVLAVLTLFGAACGENDADTAGSSSTGAGARAEGPLSGELTVAAATSLTNAFTRIGEEFQAAYPGVELTFTFDASSALTNQLLEGAPADVFASAAEADLAELTEAGLVAGVPSVFARNELVIVTKPGNPEGVSRLDDLVDVGIVSLCGAEVPCGRYAQQSLDAAGVAIPESRVTRGPNAGATLNAVSQGDAVAGVVYVTDAAAAGDAVDTAAIPADRNVVASYPITVLASSGTPELAAAFVAFVSSPVGRAVLEELGFLPPA